MIAPTDPATGLARLSWVIFAVTLTIFISVLVFFDEKPPTPPSAAQDQSAEYNQNTIYLDILKAFFFDIDFVFLFVTYGINVGKLSLLRQV